MVAILLEGMGAVGLIWMLRRQPTPHSLPPLATFKVDLVEDPSPSNAGGAAGTGASDPRPKPDPMLSPMADLIHLEDHSKDKPSPTSFDPLLPMEPGGDGHSKGEGKGEGDGIGPTSGIKGMGPGGLRVRIGDMEILHREDPVYPTSEMANGIEDLVELEITIDEHGVPLEVKVRKAKVPRLAEEALRAIKQWRFAPVRDHGVPVRATFRMDVDFMIANKRAHAKKADPPRG